VVVSFYLRTLISTLIVANPVGEPRTIVPFTSDLISMLCCVDLGLERAHFRL